MRLIVSPTRAWEANAGTIRGDFSLSTQSNIVHASESVEAGKLRLEDSFLKMKFLNIKKLMQILFTQNTKNNT